MNNSGYNNFVFILTVFCFFQIAPISAEVQPYSIIAIVLWCFWKGVNVNVAGFTIFSIYGFFILAGIFKVFDESEGQAYPFIASFISLTSGPIVYYYFKKNNYHISEKKIIFIVNLSLALGVCQIYFSDILDAIGFTKVMQVFVPRFSGAQLTEWDRGVTLFAPEPAMMAPILFQLFGMIAILNQEGSITRKKAWFSIFALSYLGYVTGSVSFYSQIMVFAVTYVAIHFFSLATNYRKSNNKIRIFILLVFSSIFYLSFLHIIQSNTRLSEITEIITKGLDLDAFIIINEISGSRFGVNWAAFSNWNNLGGGFGSWFYQFQALATALPIDLRETTFFQNVGTSENIKPSSFFALLVIDLGFFGIIISTLYLFIFFEPLKNTKIQDNQLIVSIYATCVIMLLIGGFPLSLPAYWVLLGSIAKYLDRSSNYPVRTI